MRAVRDVIQDLRDVVEGNDRYHKTLRFAEMYSNPDLVPLSIGEAEMALVADIHSLLTRGCLPEEHESETTAAA